MKLCKPFLGRMRPHDVWQFGAGRPRVAVLGGVHGNEITGVEVVKALVQEFSNKDHTLLKGELTLAIGNPMAVSHNTRYLQEDLNRCFDGRSLEDSEILERKRAALLAPYLADLDLLLDLHATNKPSTPFARLPGPVKGRRERFQEAEGLFLRNLHGCQTILWDPHELIAGGSMTDEYAFRYAPKDVKAASTYICLESGQAADVTSVKMIHLAVLQSLHHLGMLQNISKAGLSEGLLAWQHFEIAERFSLDQRGFQWVNGHGAYNFQVVPPGEVYGVRGEEKLRAPEGRESYMVFPKVRALWAEGKPLGWLAWKLKEEEL